MNNLVLTAVALLALMYMVEGRTECYTNDDCTYLGSSAICVKSACESGTCACQRGYALRFLGNLKYKCVKMKRVGESCSADESDGVCAAEESNCVNSTCQCNNGTESRFGGEKCLTIGSAFVAPSESTSSGLGTNCATSSISGNGYRTSRQYTGNPVSSLANYPLDYTPPQCACNLGFHTELVNDYSLSDVIGFLYPLCVESAVGDLCIDDADCGQIQRADGMGGWTGTDAAQCVNFKCQCANSTYTSDITGLFCAPALAHGAQCMISGVAVTSNIGVCDGTLGLRCGSPCDTATLYGSRNFTCACDPAYSESGTTCSANGEGATCNGDQNCRTLGRTAACIDGICVKDSGAGIISYSAGNVFIIAVLTAYSFIVHL